MEQNVQGITDSMHNRSRISVHIYGRHKRENRLSRILKPWKLYGIYCK